MGWFLISFLKTNKGYIRAYILIALESRHMLLPNILYKTVSCPARIGGVGIRNNGEKHRSGMAKRNKDETRNGGSMPLTSENFNQNWRKHALNKTSFQVHTFNLHFQFTFLEGAK